MSTYFYFLIFTDDLRTCITVQELSTSEHTKSKDDYDIVNELTYPTANEAIKNAKRIAKENDLTYEKFEPRYVDSPAVPSKYLY